MVEGRLCDYEKVEDTKIKGRFVGILQKATASPRIIALDQLFESPGLGARDDGGQMTTRVDLSFLEADR